MVHDVLLSLSFTLIVILIASYNYFTYPIFETKLIYTNVPIVAKCSCNQGVGVPKTKNAWVYVYLGRLSIRVLIVLQLD